MNGILSGLTGVDISWQVCLLRLLLSFEAGVIMGLERKLRMRFVGIRTLVLICVSSCVIMLLSEYLSAVGNGDTARLAAQVVSGIGFLGGGAILREGFNVKGLTSAAIIWTAAALGLAIGAGFLLPALVALGIVLVTLVLIEFLEERFFPAEDLKVLTLTCSQRQPEMSALKQAAARFGIVVASLSSASSLGSSHLFEVSYEVHIPKAVDFVFFANCLREEFDVVDVVLK